MGSVYKPKYQSKDGLTIKESAVYWAKYYKNGKPIRESTGTIKYEDAKRFLKLKEGRVARGLPLGVRLDRVTLDDLEKDYLNDYEINGKRSIIRARQLAAHLKEFFGGYRAVDITTDRIRAYVKFRKDQAKEKERTLANGTINCELAALKRMLNLGAQAGRVVNRPYFEMLEENNARSGYFERDEYLALRGVLPDHAKVPVAIAYHTGMRKGEILGLQWDQVNLVEGKIHLTPDQTKNKTPRTIFLRAELLEVLMIAKQIRDREYLNCPWVCQKDGQRLKSIKRAWVTALKHVGLEGRLFHDFRRTAIRDMVRAQVPEKVAMAISGHRTRSIFDRYNIVSEADLERAAEKIAIYHEGVKIAGQRRDGQSHGQSRAEKPAFQG